MRHRTFALLIALGVFGLVLTVTGPAGAKRPQGCHPRKPPVCATTTTTSTTRPSTTSTTAGPTTTAPTTSTTVATTTSSTTTTLPPTTTTVPTGGSLLWHGDADQDTDFGDQTRFLGKNAEGMEQDHLVIANDPLGMFGKVYRAHLTAADIEAGRNRSEWKEALTSSGELNLWGENAPATTDVFVGWRSLFTGDYALTGADNDGNVLQWKGDSTCGGPAVGMTIRDNRLSVRTIDGDYLAYMGPTFSSLMGEWHDIVLRVNFSKTSSGFVELWLDGVQQTMVNGQTRIQVPTVCPNDSRVWPKWGVYGMDVGTGAGPVHWLESPRIGTSYSAVVPR